MPKWVKFILGLVLLPICAGAGLALYRVLRASSQADTFWVALLAGGACWLVIYVMLPKPMWIYVFGHELTHAVWTWCMGGKVKRLKVTSRGGHVIVTKNNFLIALAPYFFPLYAIIVAILWGAGHGIWGWSAHVVWFHLLLGAAYSFHLTLTWHILKSRQPDITENGYLFSFAIIFLGNVTVLLLSIPLLTASVSVLNALMWWGQSIAELVQLVFLAFRR